MFTPSRVRGHEILDDPSADPQLAIRSLRDVAIANRLFGGRQAILRSLQDILMGVPANGSEPLSLLDIGTGVGDIPAAAYHLAQRLHRPLTTMGLERASALTAAARANCAFVVTGDALALPLADASIDIVICSQVLHHFDTEDAAQLLRECTRVSRRAVIVGDLRRSWLAVGGLWVSSFMLGFHPVSRHDGIVSIRRGFTASELARLIASATGHAASVSNGWGWRITATWSPTSSSAA